ncbi:MAG: putative (di)nucleoside polyphosphate hydrolase [Candidatus Peregrinibacteria bacterium Gr01-1014_25]|nr:MAG: putative (di)nucleoside polyphosphate hydrolase [Candidatus Peregrinibacteria bacterium Gr01-1014_25]
MQEVYRQAASILVLRRGFERAPDGEFPYEILLLHKPRKRDAWQLPQGGMESGESPTQAALRELHEEAGITDVTVLGESSEIYQYDFPPSYRRFRPDNVRGQKIHFILATVPVEMPVKVDGKEINAYLWVTERQLPKHVRREVYRSLILRLLHEAAALLSR